MELYCACGFATTDQGICLSLTHQTIKETPSHHGRIFFHLKAYTILKPAVADKPSDANEPVGERFPLPRCKAMEVALTCN